MGLGITVGILSDLLENDPEGAEWVESELAAVNKALTAQGVPSHQEPRSCEVWSGDGYGYGGLHALREVAALTWQGQPIPRDFVLDGRDAPAAEAHFTACLPVLEQQKTPGLLSRLFGRASGVAKMPFIHLVAHSDAQGYYIPQDFPVPVMPARMDDEFGHLWPTGSVSRLSDELDALAEVLEMPKDMLADDSTLQDFVENPASGADKPLWQVQPIAAYSCALLREACIHARRTGAAIAFG